MSSVKLVCIIVLMGIILLTVNVIKMIASLQWFRGPSLKWDFDNTDCIRSK